MYTYSLKVPLFYYSQKKIKSNQKNKTKPKMRKSTSKYKWTKKIFSFFKLSKFFSKAQHQSPIAYHHRHRHRNHRISIRVPASVVECRATYVSSTTICTRRNDDYDEAGFNAAIQSLEFSVIFWTLWYRHTMANIQKIYILKQKIAFVYLKRGKKNS